MGIIFPTLPDPYNLERPPLLPFPYRGRNIIESCQSIRDRYRACFQGPGPNHNISTRTLLSSFRLAHKEAAVVRFKVKQLWARLEYSTELKEEIEAHFRTLMRDLAYFESLNREYRSWVEVELADEWCNYYPLSRDGSETS